MSGAGGKRRSLLANAIESIGTTPAPTGDALAAQDTGVTTAEKSPDEPTASSFLERRGLAFDEIARTVKRPTIRLKPSECSIWQGNARDHAALNHERCATLIDSIREEGSNREPVVVRRTPNAQHPYELIVGTRRHFSVAWLNANNHSEIDLIARIEGLDDEAAFRLADLENREREDVTDLERARNYHHAVGAYYNGVRSQMAQRLAISKQSLHNLLQLAELPDDVVAAFADPADLKVRHGMRLSPLLKDERYREVLLTESQVIAREQISRREAGSDKIDGSKVCERLAAAALVVRVRPNAKLKPVLVAKSGRTLGTILSDTRAKGITININPAEPISVDDIMEALRPAIEDARFVRK